MNHSNNALDLREMWHRIISVVLIGFAIAFTFLPAFRTAIGTYWLFTEADTPWLTVTVVIFALIWSYDDWVNWLFNSDRSPWIAGIGAALALVIKVLWPLLATMTKGQLAWFIFAVILGIIALISYFLKK